jgi:hypothetical protein
MIKKMVHPPSVPPLKGGRTENVNDVSVAQTVQTELLR